MSLAWIKHLAEKPIITKEQAVLIAQKECADRGWEWEEPIKIRSGLGVWVVWTHHGWRGVNAIIRIDKWNGKVVAASFIPR